MGLRLTQDRARVAALVQPEVANVLKTVCTSRKRSLRPGREILDALAERPIDMDGGPAPVQCERFGLHTDESLLALPKRARITADKALVL